MIKVLIVDDEPKAIELINSYLSHFSDFELIKTFRNGLKALEFVNTEQIDVVFLDINMPVMNGWEFLEELKSYPEIIDKRMCIHMLSSSIAAEDLNKAKEYSFVQGYITKPLMREDLTKLRATG